MCQFGGEISIQLPLTESPAPVAAMEAGSIHAGLAAQAEDILQRHDAEIRGRALRSPDKGPMNAVLRAPNIGLGISLFVFCGTRIPPARNRIVVVSPRIDDFSL